MTTIARRIVIALLLFTGGFAALTGAREARRVADLYARLATLQYEDVANAPYDEEGWRLPVQLPSLEAEEMQNRLTASYWQQEFDALTNPIQVGESTGQAANDPHLLFVAANAAFRKAQARVGDDRAIVVERLDRVVEAYGDVLRASPSYTDASFNYEYVSRFRDAVASAPPRRRPATKELAEPPIPSPDLPTGATLHGHPGRPPVEIPGSDFRIIAPMPSGEREETDPGEGAAPRRRG